MEADFSGYATKAGLRCSDGRTIMAHAFKEQDNTFVPLVWQHGHSEVSNVLGKAKLEHREDGVYVHGYFNKTTAGQDAKEMVLHGDITNLSIYANQLVEKSKQVLHGAIREVSLVISGANPGAKIEHVALQHSDGSISEILEEEAVIFNDAELFHENNQPGNDDQKDSSPAEPVEVAPAQAPENKDGDKPDEAFKDKNDTKVEGDKPAEDADSVKPENKDGDDPDAVVEHADKEETVQDIWNSMTPKQRNVTTYFVNEALEKSSTAQHSDNPEGSLTHQEGTDMSYNVFDQGAKNAQGATGPTLTHDQMTTILDDAQKMGSFKESFLAHAQDYGIENIDIMFPDARTLSNTPELISRRMEWVQELISGTRKSPFSRIKSIVADITADEARAKGYVKGSMKKDEIIKLLKRVTTPTTIYKKQKLDRDDIVDITDLDVVAWLKAEMRLMLDEELARAVLVGDGRDSDDEDKINEDHIRPIASDSDMYTHKITIASELTGHELVEEIIRARKYYKGTGTPTMFLTENTLTDLLILKDKVNRRLYPKLEDLAAELRVSKIVPAEVLDDHPDILAIIVNPTDYTIGSDRGGNVSMFDDFDIDYNQYKYLIETRVSGALTKPKSALVVRRILGTQVIPDQPTYNPTTHTITIPNKTGVIYSIDGTDVAAGPQVIEETTEVESRPAQGYYFPSNINTDWVFTYQP